MIPFIVPPLISQVVTLPKSAIVFPAFVQFPITLSRSSVVVDVLPKDPVKETYVVQQKRLSAQKREVVNVAVEMTAVDQYSFSSNLNALPKYFIALSE